MSEIRNGLTRLAAQLRSQLAAQASALRWLAILAATVLLPFFVSVTSLRVFATRAAGLAVIFGLLLLAGVASRLLFAVLCVLLAASAVVHQHVSRHWGGGQFDSRAEAAFESPPEEFRQYLAVHVDAIDLAFIVGAVLSCIVLAWACWRMRPWAAAARLTAAIAVVAGVGFIALAAPTRQLKGFPPIEPVWRTAIAKHRYDQLEQRAANLQQRPIANRDCRLKYPKVVVVIGESALSDRMSVFGYARPTTPFAVQSRPHAFDALAPSNQTRYSLAMMLTGAAPGAFDSFFTSHSLIGELQACGYHTAWLSNQGRRGEWDSFATSIAMEADEQVFLNELSWVKDSFDGRLVDEVRKRGYAGRERQAIFLHLIGSHVDYRERFPEGFGFADPRTIGEQYDNSILYTDHVLSELYRLFSGEGLLFVYVSDHGQMVSEAKFGSGFMPGHKDEYRTPLLVWTDDQPAIDVIRRQLGDGQLNLESLDDILRFLLGMTSDPRVSTSPQVSVLAPEIVRDYRTLPALGED